MEHRQIHLEDINFLSMIKDILRNLWVVILITVAVWMGVGTYARMAFVPEYTSSVTFAVSARGGNSALNSLSITRGMTEIFSAVFESEVLKSKVGQQMGTTAPNYDIQAEVIPETNILRVTVVADTPEQSFLALKYTIENYGDISEYMFQNTILTVLKAPNVPMAPSNSLNTGEMKKQASAAAALLSLLAIAAFSAARETVQTKAGARHNLEGELYGTISHDEKNISGSKHPKQQEKWAKMQQILHGKTQNKTAALITNPLVSYHFREDCQKLCARLDYSMRHRGEKVLTISSAAENEGKSTVAANLALALASRKRKVLLIDCDFRKPALQKIFEVEKGTSTDFSAYLMDEENKISVEDVLVKHSTYKHLCLAVNQAYSEVPQRLITSAGMKDFIQEMKELFDYIIIDSPPMLVATDTEALTDVVDTSLLVVRQDWTFLRDVNDCIEDLRRGNARFAGYVLNNYKNDSLLGWIRKHTKKTRYVEE